MSVEPIGLLTLAIGLATLFAGAEMAMLCFVPMTLLGSAGAGDREPSSLRTSCSAS